MRSQGTSACRDVCDWGGGRERENRKNLALGCWFGSCGCSGVRVDVVLSYALHGGMHFPSVLGSVGVNVPLVDCGGQLLARLPAPPPASVFVLLY
jgi:hypothetical protein